jgi:hypothetical protein
MVPGGAKKAVVIRVQLRRKTHMRKKWRQLFELNWRTFEQSSVQYSHAIRLIKSFKNKEKKIENSQREHVRPWRRTEFFGFQGSYGLNRCHEN